MSCTIEIPEVCKACNGTGIYVGMAERDGYGVVCSKCKGTGRFLFKYTYELFTERRTRNDVDTVIRVNPGICVGGDKMDFGGMDYSAWLSGHPFPPKSEMREYACPAWWYQCDGSKKKPDWCGCVPGGRFANCNHFHEKEKCWERWDKEQP